jgi:L-Ala-D/L-Glu epimerase
MTTSAANIDEVQVGTLDLELRQTFRTHWKEIRKHANLHVRIRSGATWGEGEAYTMDVGGGMASLSASDLTGKDVWELGACIEPISDAAARSAVDLALHDLLGKLQGVPVRRLLGLPHATRTTCVSVGIDETAVMLARAKDWIRRGFPILKIKLTADSDLDLLRQIREVGGPWLRIWVDANQAFSPAAAVAVGRELARIGVEIFEQPLAIGSMDAYSSIRPEIPIPIILDEEIRSPEDVARAARAGGIDGINVKLAKIGGLRAGLRAIHIARAHGLKILLGCFFESSLGISAAASLLSHADYVDLDAPLHLVEDPYRGLVFRGAEIDSPETPGLGVTR